MWKLVSLRFPIQDTHAAPQPQPDAPSATPPPQPDAQTPTPPLPAENSIVEEPQVTWAPSFDCTKASTFAEKAVCTDTLLGKLDGALSQNYKYMLASDIGDGARKDLKATQKKWLDERNKCTENQCLANTYRKRMDEICEYPVISGVHPICTSSDEIK